jgi:transcriptional regulator with XRE-family HTH domain
LETLKAFAQAIRQIRKEKNLSQEKFATMCGIHTTHLSRIERMVREPSLKTIYKIADGCEMSGSELLKFVDELRDISE